MANYAPPVPAGRRSSRVWLWIATAVFALAVGVVVGRWVIPAESSTPESGARPTDTATTPGDSPIGAPHGPATITQGVPSGYTHDEAGAATAGVNAVQLVVNLAHGQADPETASRTWPASDADDGTRSALSAAPTSPEDIQTSKLPATTRVTDYSDNSATVEVWVVSVGSTSGAGTTLTAADWSTHTVELTWESNDWKVSGLRSEQGPEPGDSASPNTEPLQNGLYTYYID